MFYTALNADNLSANKVIYVAATGCTDLLGCAVTIFVLKHLGRKSSSCILFAVTSLSMLTLLVVPFGKWLNFSSLYTLCLMCVCRIQQSHYFYCYVWPMLCICCLFYCNITHNRTIFNRNS